MLGLLQRSHDIDGSANSVRLVLAGAEDDDDDPGLESIADGRRGCWMIGMRLDGEVLEACLVSVLAEP